MAAIDAAARQHHQTASDFMRQMLVRELKRAGVRLNADGHVEQHDSGGSSRAIRP